jgi:hypothetical protein
VSPAEVLAKGAQLTDALTASEDAPPEALLIVDLLIGVAFNVAKLANPPAMVISPGEQS